MVIFLLLLILLAVLGVLGLALKIAAALVLGLLIAVTTVVLVGYLMIRGQIRKAQRSLEGAQPPVQRSAGTTVEIGQPRRDGPPVDDRY
jgi:small-conductance mechanosensitive channel